MSLRIKERSEVIVLYNGFSSMVNHKRMSANASCTLVKGIHNIIIDTMTPWDSDKILTGIAKHNIKPHQINFVISTHGHSDHIGNNNLFLRAKHIVGFSISFRGKYFPHAFDKREEYIINESVKVIPTPGHTLSDVTVIVKTKEDKIIAIVGDLFECQEDIDNSNLWREAGSEDPALQIINRWDVARLADWIVPGHGPKFQVTDEIRNKLLQQLRLETDLPCTCEQHNI